MQPLSPNYVSVHILYLHVHEHTHVTYFLCCYASSYAQVSIKLRNRGHDAYKPKEYGQSITVERRITSDGSGSYKLKSHDGR